MAGSSASPVGRIADFAMKPQVRYQTRCRRDSEDKPRMIQAGSNGAATQWAVDGSRSARPLLDMTEAVTYINVTEEGRSS